MQSPDPNRSTLEAYNAHVAEYVAGTSDDINAGLAAWIDKALALVPAGSTILEIGTGTGRDAEYIEARGFAVIRSDASTGFVEHLRGRGKPAIVLDVVRDDLGGPHAMIFADAVMLHLPRPVAEQVLARIHAALRPGGVLACSLKRGDGEEWSSAKLGAFRYFCYWQPDAFRAALERAGFHSIDIDVASMGPQDWLMVTAIA